MSAERVDAAKSQAKAQLSSIVDLIKALDVDYYEFNELVDSRAYAEAEYEGDDLPSFLAEWDASDDGRRLAELRELGGEFTSEDDVRVAIETDPLSVEYRSGWYTGPIAGNLSNAAVEFQILLCTGGPAVRIRGDIDDNGLVESPYIEYQDWGTPWTRLATSSDEDGYLQRYCDQLINI